ncbi:MAG: SIMPL domain-containing protein, partial [Nanoarchaeota archaeon]
QFGLSGEVIDAGTNAEAMINYVNFELSNDKQNEYKALAYKQASQDARIKAESIAEGLEMQIDEVVSVSVSQFNYNPWPVYSNRGGLMMAEASDAKVATTNLQPGEQEISGDVSVVYRIS